MDRLEAAKKIYADYSRRIKYHQNHALVSANTSKGQRHNKQAMENIIEMNNQIKMLGCRVDGTKVVPITQEWIDFEKSQQTKLDALVKKLNNPKLTPTARTAIIREIVIESGKEHEEA